MEKNTKPEVIILTKCGCFTLKTGTIILSIIDIILNIVAIVFWALLYNAHMEERSKENINGDSESSLRYFIITMIIKQFTEMIANFVLICCSQMKLTYLMTEWISLKKGLLIFSATVIWLSIIASFLSAPIGVGFIMLLCGNLFIAGGIYSWLVIYNRNREIQIEDQPLKIVNL